MSKVIAVKITSKAIGNQLASLVDIHKCRRIAPANVGFEVGNVSCWWFIDDHLPTYCTKALPSTLDVTLPSEYATVNDLATELSTL